MTDGDRVGVDARDERLEDAMRRFDAYHVERTLAEKPGLLTELATRRDSDGSTTRVVLKHIALELANPFLWDRYRLADTAHLPKLLDVIGFPDEYVVVLQYIAGIPLQNLVDRKGALGPGRVRSIMDDLCDAASSLSAVGIVHRDIKPSNVILSPNGAFLIDPGIARVSNTHAYEGPEDHDTVILGTYGYASPEQLGFAQTDARSDVFSLARVMGFMLTGLSPTEPAYIEALRNGPGIPEGLRGVISRACALEPSVRQANAQALKRQIDANVSLNDTGSPRPVEVYATRRATERSTNPQVHPERADVDRRDAAKRQEHVAAPQTRTSNHEDAIPTSSNNPSASVDVGVRDVDGRSEHDPTLQKPSPVPDETSATPRDDPSTALDSDDQSVESRPEPDAALQDPTPIHYELAPTPPKGLALTADSDGRSADARKESDEALRHPTPHYEGTVAEPHPRELSEIRRVAIRLIEGFFGFFGTVFIIASFSLGDTSLPGWGNICFGLTIGIFWNYLPAYELVQFFRSAGRYRRTDRRRPNVFKRAFMWFGIGFAILAVVSTIVHTSGYQGPQ